MAIVGAPRTRATSVVYPLGRLSTTNPSVKMPATSPPRMKGTNPAYFHPLAASRLCLFSAAILSLNRMKAYSLYGGAKGCYFCAAVHRSSVGMNAAIAPFATGKRQESFHSPLRSGKNDALGQLL